MKFTLLIGAVLSSQMALAQDWPKPSRFFPAVGEVLSVKFPTIDQDIKHCGPASKKIEQTDQNLMLSFTEPGTHTITYTQTTEIKVDKELFISQLEEKALLNELGNLPENIQIKTIIDHTLLFDVEKSSTIICSDKEFYIKKNTNGSFSLMYRNNPLVGYMIKHRTITNTSEELEGQHTPKNTEVYFNFTRGIHFLTAEYIKKETDHLVHYKTTFCFGKK